MGCQAAPETVDEAPAEVTEGPHPIDRTCREENVPWNPLSDPIRLPCQPTVEPCDGIDNDADGITDPHCPSLACTTDADCTYGGLVLDADCNELGDVIGSVLIPVCNPIDGVSKDTYVAHPCWGKLCPPGRKCVNGDCVTPGTAPPYAPCDDGADCPINAGCIPDSPAAATGTCVYFCQHVACPTGFECRTVTTPGAGAVTVTHQVCEAEGQLDCEEGRSKCAVERQSCRADSACAAVLECIQAKCGDPSSTCDEHCPTEPGSEPWTGLLTCVTAACGG